MEHLLGEVAILGKKKINRPTIEIACRSAAGKIGNEISTLLKVLIAGGALLAVPARLVDNYRCGQDRQLFDGKSEVCEVGDAAVAVLEVKRVEKLLGLLLVEVGQRFAQREGRAGIPRHTISQDFGVSPMDGIDIGGGVVGLRSGRVGIDDGFPLVRHCAES